MSKGAAAEIIQALEALRDAAREFAARETKLLAACHSKGSKEKRERDAAIEVVARQLEEDITAADADFDSARGIVDERNTRSCERIQRAQHSAREKTLAVIEETRGRRKFTLQKEMLDVERKRDADLATNERIITTFRKAHEELTKLEASALAVFRKSAAYLRSQAAGQELEDAEYELAATVEELGELLTASREELEQFRRRLYPKICGRFVPMFVVSLLPVGLAFGMSMTGNAAFSTQLGGIATGVLLVVSLILWGIAFAQTKPAAESVGSTLGRARGLHTAFSDSLDDWKKQQADIIETGCNRAMSDLKQQWALADETAEVMTNTVRQRAEEKAQRISAKNTGAHQSRMAAAESVHADAVCQIKVRLDKRRGEIEQKCQLALDQHAAELQSGLSTLEVEWHAKSQPVCALIDQARTRDGELFPHWTGEGWKEWTVPVRFPHAARFGSIEVDVPKLCEVVPKDRRLAVPLPSRFPVPALAIYPDAGGVLLETGQTGREEAIGTLNTLVLRLLAGAPAGKVHFTFIDPVALGQSFSGLMHLADYEERLVNSRIWTQPGQIDEKLAELNEHMEKVIQMYLRNDYQTIMQYNEEAGNIAEAYHFVVVADFPSGFNDSAARRLVSIATSGARCGVFAMIHWDRRQQLPHDFVPDALRKSSLHLSAKGNQWSVNGSALAGISLALQPPPDGAYVTEFIQRVGAASRDSNRVEVPFGHVAPKEEQIWSEDTTEELRVPIGRSAATKLQYLALGRDTKQHALVAGKTGSGKSTLFHVAITNLALWCSPEQVEFYLIDFKKGVEFKAYATHRLPHARVVAIESDREFGLSVLQRVDDELRRRGDLFRKLGAQNLPGYKKAASGEPMPRCLLLIDEFQELFVEDDKVSQTASVLLDRIVRQGRAFGIHVILGSQTLGGAYTVARTTLGQMVVRIALQCNEADAYLIMDDGNPAPRLLSRPGEGIYNDAAGAIEGNSPFQAVWLSDEERDTALTTVRQRANIAAYPGPIVFEGNAPASVRENQMLQALLNAGAIQSSTTPRFWLGAPNSIKGPTEAAFDRQSGNHLLIIGQRDEAVLSMLGVALVSLAAQFPRDGLRLMLLDGNTPGSSEREFLEGAARAVPHGATLLKYGDIAETLNELVQELERRTTAADGADAPPVFLFIHQMQRFGKLRHEDDFSFSDSGTSTPKPDALLSRLLTEGASAGIHVIATFDTCNNVNRFLSRKLLSEFEMRVLFQMSANDSALLIDSPKAGTLGLHRAIFYNEQEGYLEVFRPYALPDAGWVDEAAVKLGKAASPDT